MHKKCAISDLNRPAEKAREFKQKIHELKIPDNYFIRRFDECHEINRKIHQIEANGINTSDEYFEELKKKRLALKDDIRNILGSGPICVLSLIARKVHCNDRYREI